MLPAAPGETAYTAYCGARGWKSVQGDPLPQFGEQADDLKAAWSAAESAAQSGYRMLVEQGLSMLAGAVSPPGEDLAQGITRLLALCEQTLKIAAGLNVQMKALEELGARGRLTPELDKAKSDPAWSEAFEWMKLQMEINGKLSQELNELRAELKAANGGLKVTKECSAVVLPNGDRIVIKAIETYAPGGDAEIIVCGSGRELGRWKAPFDDGQGKTLDHDARCKIRDRVLNQFDNLFDAVK